MRPIFSVVCWSVLMTGSACSAERVEPSLAPDDALERNEAIYALSSRISAVMADPAFGQYGRLLFPVQNGYWSGETLEQLRLTYYNHIDPQKTVEIVNYFKTQALAGETIFYPIYTEAEMRDHPEKRDTGLFFFRGKPGAPFAVCNAGGALPMWVRCTIAFPMPWNWRNTDTMPLH